MLTPAKQHTVAPDELALMRKVNARQRDVLHLDVLPHIHLCPVADRENAEVLAKVHPAVEQVPQLGPLVLRVPLAERVAVGEETFLRARLFLIAPRAAEAGVELVLLDGVEQRGDLQAVAAWVRAGFLPGPAGLNLRLHAADNQLRTDLLGQAIAEHNRLAEVVPGVHVHQRERQLGRPKSLLR